MVIEQGKSSENCDGKKKAFNIKMPLLTSKQNIEFRKKLFK